MLAAEIDASEKKQLCTDTVNMITRNLVVCSKRIIAFLFQSSMSLYLRVRGLLFIVARMSLYPGKKREGEKLSLWTGIVQKARDFQGHKYRYARKVKNNLENGFRSWSCSLVMTFSSDLKKNVFCCSTLWL